MSNLDIQQVRDLAEALAIISAMPEDASIGAGLAAVFLGVNEKKLEKIRADTGSGLPYIQYPNSATKARNQDVYYVLGDLRQWRERKKVDSTLEAARIRGLTFSTMEDLLEEQPYWQQTVFGESRAVLGGEITKSYPRIIGHIQTVSDEEFASLLHDENAEVIWLSLPDALKEDWASPKARAPFHEAYIELLQGWIDQSNAGQEAAELKSVIA